MIWGYHYFWKHPYLSHLSNPSIISSNHITSNPLSTCQETESELTTLEPWHRVAYIFRSCEVALSTSGVQYITNPNKAPVRCIVCRILLLLQPMVIYCNLGVFPTISGVHEISPTQTSCTIKREILKITIDFSINFDVRKMGPI